MNPYPKPPPLSVLFPIPKKEVQTKRQKQKVITPKVVDDIRETIHQGEWFNGPEDYDIDELLSVNVFRGEDGLSSVFIFLNYKDVNIVNDYLSNLSKHKFKKCFDKIVVQLGLVNNKWNSISPEEQKNKKKTIFIRTRCGTKSVQRLHSK